MAVNYEALAKEDFDAIVTGELTHLAIALEDEIITILADYFADNAARSDFVRLFLRRDGLTFQDKLEIARAAGPLLKDQDAAKKLLAILPRVETFKAFRNAFAHGMDETPDGVKGEIHVCLVSRSGKEKVVIVTPESHSTLLDETGAMLDELRALRKQLGSAGEQA